MGMDDAEKPKRMPGYPSYDEIQSVHLELTTRCNAGCPQCARTYRDGDNPLLPLTELSLADCQAIFPAEFIARLDRLELCGNFGDPIVAKDMIGILEWAREINPDLVFFIHTNGSARNAEFWRRLGVLCQGKNGNVIFGIDGLADTNHLYRRHTDWTRIMANAETFIGAGGIAVWSFLVFKHNQHQVGDARALAKKMGFRSFFAQPSNRFSKKPESWESGRDPVYARDGSVLYYLEAADPSEIEQKPGPLARAIENTERFENPDHLDDVDIFCMTAAGKRIYVSAEGLVFPCCWTAQRPYLYPQGPESQIAALIDAMGGKDTIDARKRPLEEIVNGPFIAGAIPASWTKPSIAEGKLRVCAETCNRTRVLDTFIEEQIGKKKTAALAG